MLQYFLIKLYHEILGTQDQAKQQIICKLSMIDELLGKVHQGQSFQDHSKFIQEYYYPEIQEKTTTRKFCFQGTSDRKRH